MGPADPYVTSRTTDAARNFVLIASAGIAAASGLVLLGWILDIGVLKSGLPGYPDMKANTALCLGLLAVTTLLLARGKPLGAWVLLLPAAGGAIALLTLMQYVARADFGLDAALFPDPYGSGRHPGRMSPMTAASIALLAVSLCLHRPGRGLLAIRQTAALTAFALGLLGMTGLIYRFQFVAGMGLGVAATMALHTATALILLGIAVLALDPNAGIMRVILANRSGGRFARRMLPVAIVFPIAMGWLRMLGENAGYYDAQFGLLIGVVSAILVFSAIAIASASWLNRSEESLLDAQQALERRVQERTNDLETTVARLRAEIVLREAAEASQAESQALFRNALEYAPIGMAIVGIDGRWLRVNRALCDIVGYDERTLLQLTFQDITHPDDLRADLALLDSLVKGDIPFYQMEKRYIRRDGTPVWIMLSVSLVRDSDEQPLFLISQMEDIGMRRQAERDIAAGRQFLVDVIDALPIPLTVKNEDGRIVIANSAMATFHGKAPADIVGRTDADVFTQERAALFRAEDQALLDTGEPLVLEQKFSTIGGETRWVIKHKHRVLLNDGGRGVLTTLVDITQRKDAELAAEADRKILTEIIESLPLPLVVKDEQHRIIIANEATGRFHGTARDFMLGKTGTEFLPPQQAQTHFEEDDRALGSSEPLVVEQLMQTADGRSHWVLKHKRGVLLPDGRRWLIAVVNDITLRKNAEAALAEREAWLRLITDSSIACIGYIDTDERFRFCNKTYEHWYGLSPEEILGRSIREVVGEAGYPQVEAHYREALGGRRTHYERELVHGDRKRQILVDLIPDIDAAGRTQGVFTYASDITERKQAELALARSRKFLESVIDAIPQPVFLKDEDHRWVLLNSAFCELLGRSREQLLGRSDPDVFAQDVARKVWAEDDEVFSGDGSLIVEETSSIQKDSAVRWLLKSKRRVTMPDESTYIVGMSTDITRLKQTEEALRKSSELHRLLAENSSDLISLLTPEGAIEYASSAGTAMLGYPPDHLIGRVVMEMIHPEDVDQALEIFARVVKSQVPVVFTCRLRKADGSWSWIETSFRAIRDMTTGRTRQVIAVSRDINERVRVTSALNHFKYVLDSTLDMIFIYDVDTLRFNYVNDGAARALGIPRDRLLGMAPWEVRADIQEKDYYKSIEPFLKGEIQSRQVETVHRKADGSFMPVEVSMQLIRRPGETGTFISIARDLTERKKVEQMKNEFVSTVSHELRTPVTSIRGSLGLLAGGAAGKLPKQAKQLIDIANSNSERLIRLINDILDIEKIESGKMRFAMRAIPLRGLLEAAIVENQGYAEKFGVHFRVPVAIPDVVVRADHDRVLQVMANLLSNAAKFSPTGATIDISAAPSSATVRIAVTDRGPGIPVEFHDKIFGKFSQADASDSRKPGGTGLGLSIAKAIVEKHGCEIGFSTAPGNGTTFFFDLPLAIGGAHDQDSTDAQAASRVR